MLWFFRPRDFVFHPRNVLIEILPVKKECIRFHCQSEGGSCLAGRTGPERQSRSGNITMDTDAQVGILCKGAFFPESTHPMNVMGKAYL